MSGLDQQDLHDQTLVRWLTEGEINNSTVSQKLLKFGGGLSVDMVAQLPRPGSDRWAETTDGCGVPCITFLEAGSTARTLPGGGATFTICQLRQAMSEYKVKAAESGERLQLEAMSSGKLMIVIGCLLEPKLELCDRRLDKTEHGPSPKNDAHANVWFTVTHDGKESSWSGKAPARLVEAVAFMVAEFLEPFIKTRCDIMPPAP